MLPDAFKQNKSHKTNKHENEHEEDQMCLPQALAAVASLESNTRDDDDVTAQTFQNEIHGRQTPLPLVDAMQETTACSVYYHPSVCV